MEVGSNKLSDQKRQFIIKSTINLYGFSFHSSNFCCLLRGFGNGRCCIGNWGKHAGKCEHDRKHSQWNGNASWNVHVSSSCSSPKWLYKQPPIFIHGDWTTCFHCYISELNIVLQFVLFDPLFFTCALVFGVCILGISLVMIFSVPSFLFWSIKFGGICVCYAFCCWWSFNKNMLLNKNCH